MKSNNTETYKEIAELRREVALSEDPEERELKTQEITNLKRKLATANKKAPVIVPIKKAPTVGDKMEKKIAMANKKSGARLGQNRVRI